MWKSTRSQRFSCSPPCLHSLLILHRTQAPLYVFLFHFLQENFLSRCLILYFEREMRTPLSSLLYDTSLNLQRYFFLQDLKQIVYSTVQYSGWKNFTDKFKHTNGQQSSTVTLLMNDISGCVSEFLITGQSPFTLHSV